MSEFNERDASGRDAEESVESISHTPANTEPVPVQRARQTEYNQVETGQISLDDIRSALGSPKSEVEQTPRIPTEIWALIGATFLIAIGFSLVVPVLPQYAKGFGVSATLVTVVVSAFAAVRLLWAPAAGWLLQKAGERRNYSIGLLIVASSSIAMAFADSYLQLLIFRGLGGVGSAMFTIAAASMMVKYSPPEIRGKVSALWSGAFLIGNVTGPFFGGLLAQAGMTVPFITYGVALTVAAIIVSIVLRRSAKAHRGEPEVPKPALKLSAVWPNRAYRASLAFGLANGWSNMGVRIAVVPLFIGATINEEPLTAGLAVATGAVGNVLALQWSGRVSDRRGRRPLIIAGLLVSSIGVLSLVWAAGRLDLVLLAMFISGVGSGLSMPVSQAAMSDIVGREHTGGQPLALFQMMQDLGMILGPMIAGVLIDLAGFSWSFVVASVVLLIPGAAWIAARDTLVKP